jgi:hypothetical protein
MTDPRDIETERLEPTPCTPHHCGQERRIRHLERAVDDHDKRLHDGDLVMRDLKHAITSLQSSVDALSRQIAKHDTALTAPNPVWSKVKDALISRAVPTVVVMALWLAAKSGVIPGLAAT